MVKYLSELFEHMNWADSVVWKAVLSNPETEKDEKIRKLLVHLHLVQKAFLSLWIKEEIKIPDMAKFLTLQDIKFWASEYYPKLDAFLSSFDDKDLDKHLEVPWAKKAEEIAGRKACPVTIGESMLQVTAHSTYHRGQINSRLRELGSEPPLVDFIAWIWFGKPGEKLTMNDEGLQSRESKHG